MRDDFSGSVKEILAKRVGWNCSSPTCHKPTAGPHADAMKAVNIGVAAHITAASPGGPRYDPSLTAVERSHANNGIWLCHNCGKLVDNDATRYTEQLLREWKRQAEEMASREIEGKVSHHPSSGHINPLHKIIDLLARYHAAFLRVHHANSEEARHASHEEWKACHPDVYEGRSVRDDTIRALADPAIAWLSKSACPHVDREDFDLIEKGARELSRFAVSPWLMSMPNIYSTAGTDEDELWRRWHSQGDRCIALGSLIFRLKELAARAGQMWAPSRANQATLSENVRDVKLPTRRLKSR